MTSPPPNNPQSEIRNPKSPLTDSPWFYTLVFSLMALFALLVIGPKYGNRQSSLERNYQARTRVTEDMARNNSTGEARTNEVAEPRAYASPSDTLIPLWPLATILVLVALFAAFMLRRGALRAAAVQPKGRTP